jgi:pimeloyl-ACP methyl ester carboxylesterase
MECVLENITIHYETYGEGRPVIILPGWTMNTRMTAHQIEPYFQGQAGWQRIYIDPPGHGKTPGKDWITNQDKILEILLVCIDKLTAGQNYCLIGISLGAYLARGVLRNRTKFVDGIAMLVPVVFAEDEKRSVPPYQVLVEQSLSDAGLTQEEADFLGMSVLHTHKWLTELRSYPQIPDHENGDATFLSRIRENHKDYGFSFDVDDLPEPFHRPALIVTGRQDYVVGYRDFWSLLENYPRASYVVLDRTGHFMEETAALVQVLINEWLDRVEEYAENRSEHKKT